VSGVTEVRAGVFVFFDLVMAGLGVCHYDDVALSVRDAAADPSEPRVRHGGTA
jgi:D-serine deaminase-like pyridoxal phosphate-dependent protein